MKLIRIGVDLAKNVYQLHGVDKSEKGVWQRRLKRDNWVKVLMNNAELGCEVGMEACSGAHHWGRLLQDKGYQVKLIAPQFVVLPRRIRSGDWYRSMGWWRRSR